MTRKKRKVAKSLGEVDNNENIGFWGGVLSFGLPLVAAPIIAIMNWNDKPKKAKQALGIGVVGVLAAWTLTGMFTKD